MKKTLLFLLLFAFATAYAQLPKWSLPPYQVDFTSSSISLSDLPIQTAPGQSFI
jgi:hypothetical protein